MPQLITKLGDLQWEQITVTEALEQFIKKQKLKNLAPDTICYYTENLTRFIAFIGDKMVYEIKISDVDNYVFSLYEKELKPVTINTKLRAIRAFLYFCMENNYTQSFKVYTVKQNEEIPDTYTNKELLRLLKKPKTNNWTELRTWAFINFALGTGCRLASILEVKVGDLDFDNKLITIRHAKGRKQLLLPMSESLAEAMRFYLKFWNAEEQDILICNSQKQKLARTTIEQDVRKYNISRGVMRTSIHSFRHSYARNYIKAGGDVTKLQRLLGHSTIQVTMKYIKLYGNDLSNGYESLNPLTNIINKRIE